MEQNDRSNEKHLQQEDHLHTLEAGSETEREYAAVRLKDFKGPRVIRALLLALEDEPQVSLAAEKSLYYSVDSSAVDTLMEALCHPSRDIRSAAASLSGFIGAHKTCPSLIKLLEDDDDQVRIEAAQALGELRCREAVPGLIRMVLKDDNFQVVAYAAVSLGQIGARGARGTIKKTLRELERRTELKDAERHETYFWPGDNLWIRMNLWAALYLLGEEIRLEMILTELKKSVIIPSSFLLSLLAETPVKASRQRILRSLRRALKTEIIRGNRGYIDQLEKAVAEVERIIGA